MEIRLTLVIFLFLFLHIFFKKSAEPFNTLTKHLHQHQDHLPNKPIIHISNVRMGTSTWDLESESND